MSKLLNDLLFFASGFFTAVLIFIIFLYLASGKDEEEFERRIERQVKKHEH